MCSKRTITGSIPANRKEKEKMYFPLRALLRSCAHTDTQPLLKSHWPDFILRPGHLLGKLGNVVSIPHGHVNIWGCIIKGEGATGGLCHSTYQSRCEDDRDDTLWTTFGGAVLSLSCVWLFANPWTAAHQAPLGDSPGKNTGVDCHALLQGIFPTQGSNPGLLHCRQILYCLSQQEGAHKSTCWFVS